MSSRPDHKWEKRGHICPECGVLVECDKALEYREYIRALDNDWTGQAVIDVDLVRRFFLDRYHLDEFGHFFLHEIKFGENNRHYSKHPFGIKNDNGSWYQKPWNSEYMTLKSIWDDSKKERCQGIFAIWALYKDWSAPNNEYSINDVSISREDLDKWLMYKIKLPSEFKSL